MPGTDAACRLVIRVLLFIPTFNDWNSSISYHSILNDVDRETSKNVFTIRCNICTGIMG